jgi:hypothetical protein
MGGSRLSIYRNAAGPGILRTDNETTMKTPILRVLYWTPRVLSLLFAVFLGIFALDAFDGGPGWGRQVGAFLIHLVPTYLVVAILAVAWRWEWVGAVAFCALGVAYLATAWGRFHWSAYAVISGPLFVLAGLFLANWAKRATLRPRTS